jgi:hypothetical protein
MFQTLVPQQGAWGRRSIPGGFREKYKCPPLKRRGKKEEENIFKK